MTKFTCIDCGHIRFAEIGEILSQTWCPKCKRLAFGQMKREWVPLKDRPQQEKNER